MWDRLTIEASTGGTMHLDIDNPAVQETVKYWDAHKYFERLGSLVTSAYKQTSF